MRCVFDSGPVLPKPALSRAQGANVRLDRCCLNRLRIGVFSICPPTQPGSSRLNAQIERAPLNSALSLWNQATQTAASNLEGANPRPQGARKGFWFDAGSHRWCRASAPHVGGLGGPQRRGWHSAGALGEGAQHRGRRRPVRRRRRPRQSGITRAGLRGVNAWAGRRAVTVSRVRTTVVSGDDGSVRLNTPNQCTPEASQSGRRRCLVTVPAQPGRLPSSLYSAARLHRPNGQDPAEDPNTPTRAA